MKAFFRGMTGRVFLVLMLGILASAALTQYLAVNERQRALPDFGPLLRQRVLQLFHESLVPFGTLGLDREMESGEPLASAYQALAPGQPWYKRIT